jgi:two-component system sensor histidine kinase YesM
MKIRMNILGKIITLVTCLLVPIILLYGYSHQISIQVVRENIDNGNHNRLSFFLSQIDFSVDQLTKFSVIVSRNNILKDYLEKRDLDAPSVQFQKKLVLVDMINLQVATNGWNNQIVLHLRDYKEVISTDFSVSYEDSYLKNAELQKWSYRKIKIYSEVQSFFSRIRESDLPNVLIEVRFTDDNLRNMLNQLKRGGDGEPFFYHQGFEPILNQTADQQLVNQIISQMELGEMSNNGSRIVKVDKQKYLVNFIKSDSLGWHLVDFIPLESILSPITTSSKLFYTSVVSLLVMSVIATLLLYRNVHKPILLLQRKVKMIKEGQFSTRLKEQPNNEFDYLYVSFNEMAEQIQELIENIYTEKLRSREATLKHLQSQINPHFLYNCLFYIKNMANLGQKEAVIAMALNLGKYYRYTTRSESTMTTINKEMQLVENYLIIQNLRIPRFHYEIELPEFMLDLIIPRLLIQPIVENAIIHGIEESPNFGLVHITCSSLNGINMVIVEDNGKGMTPDEIDEFQRKVILPLDEEIGCGTWNVHQRLNGLYHGKSGLYFSQSSLGGLRVELIWESKESYSNGH